MKKRIQTYYLLIVLGIYTLFRLPSLFEPVWYADEGIYAVIGHALRSGRLLYVDIWDNKPPLLYLLYTVFDTQLEIRLISMISGAVCIVVLWHIATYLFSKQTRTFFVVSIFGALIGLPLLEGNIANAENFMILALLLAGLFILKHHSSPRLILIFSAGICCGVATLFKLVAIFETVAFALWFLCFSQCQGSKKGILLAYGIGWSLPITITLIILVAYGLIPAFLDTLMQGASYVSVTNKFIIPHGLLITKSLLLGVLLWLLYQHRRLLSPSHSFIVTWVLFSLFSAFFSERPYTHYLLVLAPSFSLSLAALNETSRYRKFLIGTMLCVVTLIFFHFVLYKNIGGYYMNALLYGTGLQTQEEYLRFFDDVLPRNYEIGEYLRQHLQQEERVFIWGNAPDILARLNQVPPGRFIVAYHILGNSQRLAETATALRKDPPQYIVVLLRTYPFSLQQYRLETTIQHARIYKRK